MDRAIDKAAMDRLVVEHLPALMRFATRLAGSVVDAEDLTQEALLKIARSWQTYRGDAPFRSWAFRILVNVFHDSASAKRQHEAVPVDAVDTREDRPDQMVEAQELQRLVAQQVSGLPPRQREVMVLITYEGFTAQQAAELLDIEVTNVHATLHHARSRLRESLEKYLANT
jgi:RNA polymerase sigma-70 factor (ECF subfamily)